MASDFLTNRDGAEQHLFYNVMPSLKNMASNLVKAAKPQVTVNAPSLLPGNLAPGSLASPPATPGSLATQVAEDKSSSKKTTLVILGFIVLAVVGAGVFWFLQKSANEQVTLPDIEAAPAKEEPKSIPEATTPKEWLALYFGKEICTEPPTCGDAADPERDGLPNIEEYNLGTDPNNRDSDGDGLADGDEVHVFSSSATQSKTANDSNYDDLDYARGGYDFKTKKVYTSTRFKEVVEAMQTYGLHPPTIVGLGDALLDVYGFSDSQALGATTIKPQGSQLPPGFEATPEAKLDRDSQRLATIKKIGAALVSYKQTNDSYPKTPDFLNMASVIKPYLGSATNTKDPINQEPFTYGYFPESNGAAFALTYYSETQSQLIRYKSSAAESDSAKETSQSADDQRKSDLAMMRSALLLYGATQAEASSGEYFIFPPSGNYKTELVPTYLSSIPKDPVTGKDYEYTISKFFDSFTLKAKLENPEAGTTGYLCNQEECTNY